ncbi:MAG TPA: antitoxin Xre/MbcA/ParS toxin-binding domain-containing protein [Planctomycetaceae bacterium]|jgi:putative toxin-antitoxin system antitoxin component (TIGR02293 family)|nr:antitoxin Xre/MbcA/ParS toxin-binding domain-containing protein [Planctomycetaceae bacterium]
MSNVKLRLIPKRATSLKQVLALKDPPTGGLAWHALLETGLPLISLRAVAKAIGVTEKYLANFLGIELDKIEASSRLGQVESDLLFAIARAYTRAATRLGTDEAGVWLITPSKALGDRAPIEALRTRIGTEYVSGLINQMGQKSPTPRQALSMSTAAQVAPVADRG